MIVGVAGKRALAGRCADRFTHSGGNWAADHGNHQCERPSASSHLIREYKSNVTGNAGIGGCLCTASGLERGGELNHGTCSRKFWSRVNLHGRSARTFVHSDPLLDRQVPQRPHASSDRGRRETDH